MDRAMPDPGGQAARGAREPDDRVLIARARGGDAAARDAMVRRYMPLARGLARRYGRPGEPLDDLVQVASIGLLKAIDGFRIERDSAFATYAVPKILGELKHYFRDSGWAVHVPRPMQQRVLEMNAVVERLALALGRSPAPAEVAAALGATLEQVLETMEAAVAHQALPLDGAAADRPLSGEDEGYDRVLSAGQLMPELLSLPEQDRLVLDLRFGEDLTQSEIAGRLGISQMQVSRVIRRALARLRAAGLAA
jgi:RNA polymerase sigma-B factor